MDVAVFSEAATPKSTLKKASHSTVSCERFNISVLLTHVRRSAWIVPKNHCRLPVVLVGIKQLEDRITMKKIVLPYIYEEVQGKELPYQLVKSTTQREQDTVIVTELLYQLQYINYLNLLIMKW